MPDTNYKLEPHHTFERDELMTSHEHQSVETTRAIQRLECARARAPHVPHPSDHLTSAPTPSQFATLTGLSELALDLNTKLVAALFVKLFFANNPGCFPTLSECCEIPCCEILRIVLQTINQKETARHTRGYKTNHPGIRCTDTNSKKARSS